MNYTEAVRLARIGDEEDLDISMRVPTGASIIWRSSI